MGVTAFVGVVGGAGATRMSVEHAATLARGGYDVAVLDAALATQGLATYVEGRIDPDVTAVLADDAALADAFVECWPDTPGHTVVAPAHAPFARLARAKTEAAARRFEDCVDNARSRFDHVVIDVAPVASNEAVAAVTTADRRALVAPATRRGADLLPRQRGRLVDIGVDVDRVLVNRAGGTDPVDTPLPEADHALPETDPDVVRPTCLSPEAAVAPAVAESAADCFDAALDLDFSSAGPLGGRL
jgi:cellulose biosynthesis protein BcsQ